MGAVAVFAFMPGTGIVHIDITGHLKADGTSGTSLII